MERNKFIGMGVALVTPFKTDGSVDFSALARLVDYQLKNGTDYLEESNYKEFLKNELEFKKDLYPPFVKLARVILSSTNGLKIKEELNEIVKDLKNNKDIEYEFI